MGLADIIFLHSLNIIGAGISALVDTVYSPFVILFAYLLLGEQLTANQFLGGGLIIGAILFSSIKLQHIPVDRSQLKYGIMLSIIAIAMMAFAIVLMKPVLNKFQGDVGKQLWFAGFRLISLRFSCGVIIGIILLKEVLWLLIKRKGLMH